MKRSFPFFIAAVVLGAAACSAAVSPSAAPTTPTQPPMTEAPTMAPATAAPSAALGDIVAVATEAGSFKTLLQAATVAGLVDTLQGPGPFTIFAPTDEAFAKLPAETLASLLADPAALK